MSDDGGGEKPFTPETALEYHPRVFEGWKNLNEHDVFLLEFARAKEMNGHPEEESSPYQVYCHARFVCHVLDLPDTTKSFPVWLDEKYGISAEHPGAYDARYWRHNPESGEKELLDEPDPDLPTREQAEWRKRLPTNCDRVLSDDSTSAEIVQISDLRKIREGKNKW